jgi:hypothetical protein
VLLALCACCLWAIPSHAEGRRLLVLLGPSEPQFWPWLRAELGSSGFSVQARKTATLPPTPIAIEEAARGASATIGVAPLEAGAGIEIWLVDPVTHQIAFRELILGLYQPSEAPDVVAVRMVETLRATLIELGQRRVGVEAPPQPATVARLAAPPPRWTLGIGGGSVFSPGGFGGVGFFDLSLGYALTPRFSLLVNGALTPFSSELHGSQGTAVVDWRWAGAALSFCVTNPKLPVRLLSGAGASLSLMTLNGQARVPFESRRLNVMSVIPHVDLGVHGSVSDRLSVGFDTSVGFAAPAVQVNFAGQEQTTWGRPVWHGRLLLETSLD